MNILLGIDGFKLRILYIELLKVQYTQATQNKLKRLQLDGVL